VIIRPVDNYGYVPQRPHNNHATPGPTPVPHNLNFLQGCNPRQCSEKKARFWSMSNEDEAIYEIFYTNPIKCCKVIVEIGAGNGQQYSVSKFFEDALNWRSLLIEASPEQYQALEKVRPKAVKKNGAFCESDHLLHLNNQFYARGGSSEVMSEIYTKFGPSEQQTADEVPCLKMSNVFRENGITHVDVMVIRVQGDALAFMRNMDWTVRVDIWIVVKHGETSEKHDRDKVVDRVMRNNQYVKAEWDIKRWCAENGLCLNNEVYLRKGFNPLPAQIDRALTTMQEHHHDKHA